MLIVACTKRWVGGIQRAARQVCLTCALEINISLLWRVGDCLCATSCLLSTLPEQEAGHLLALPLQQQQRPSVVAVFVTQEQVVVLILGCGKKG